MQTRRDLYQAYRLMTQRLSMALLQGEPDLPESPTRRHNVAMFGSALVAVVVAAIFGILGLLRPGSATALTAPGTVLIEEESGAVFVYSAPKERLIPVDNVTSARLLLGEQQVKVRAVSAASLARFRRDAMVGIAGAPKSLPAPDRLVRTPWTACVVDGVDTGNEHRPYTTLLGGIDVGGAPIEQGSAVVVEEGGQTWMLWSNRRMRVPAEAVRTMTAERPRQVPAAWLNALPEGPAFRGPDIPGLGRAVTGPDGDRYRAGTVFTVSPVAGMPARWYVLLPDGLASLTPAQAALLLQSPVIKQKAYRGASAQPVELDAATVNATKASATDLGAPDLPSTMPKVITVSGATPLCAVYSATERGSARAVLTVGAAKPIPQPPKGWFNQEMADQVLLTPGSAALVGVLPGEGRLDAVGPLYLIGDQGRRHAIPSAELLPALGYGEQNVAPLPAHLLHLIPEGPALDPEAARNPIQTAPAAVTPPQQ
ncbi:type VII secretion protein EccB [Streptosporangium sandarakinum]